MRPMVCHKQYVVRRCRQYVLLDRSTHLHCVLLRGRMLHVDGNRVGRSLRVDEQLQGKVTADLIQRSLEVPGCGSDAGCSAADHDHRVVGGHTTVAVYPLEAVPAGAHQLIMKLLGVHHSVGRQHHQHRGQSGCEHSRALCHATDRPALVGVARLFRHRVGCQDCFRRRLAAVVSGTSGTRCLPPPCPSAVVRQSGRSSTRQCRWGRYLPEPT